MADRVPDSARVRGPVVLAAIIGFSVTTALVLSTWLSISAGNNHFLSTQEREVSLALQTTVPALQQVLVNADTFASDAPVSQFQDFAADDVGPAAVFRSISLWRVTRTSVTLVSVAGPRPEILNEATLGKDFIRAVPVTTTLMVLDLLDQPVRELGFAVRMSSAATHFVVLGEYARPQSPHVQFPAGSNFAGLNFAIFLGSTTSPSALLESTIPVPTRQATADTTAPFGDQTVTILVALVARPPGVLPAPLPWWLGGGGVFLTLMTVGVVSRQLDRRARAEATVVSTRADLTVERTISSTLQRALMPDENPTFPGLDIATLYVAGIAELAVGGDWYDAIPLDAHRLMLVVGDVSGRGLHAATVMGSLRPALRAYALQGDPPATILAKLDDLVNVERDNCFATVLCALLDVPGRVVTMATAGHPPPLLVDGTGARFLRLEVGAPVGVRGPAATPFTFSVAADAALVVYTDGLIERRGVTIDDGFARLRDSATGAPGSVAELVAQLATAMVPHGSQDDLAIIAAGWTDAGEGGAARVRHLGLGGRPAARSFSGDPESVRAARRFITEALSDLPADVVDVAVLLGSELTTNAVKHAGSGFRVTITDSVSGRVRVEVADEGRGLPARRAPRPSEPGGRGIQIVESLAQAWGITVGSPSTGRTVWFELDGHGAPEGQNSHV